jgi:hypothetical protein
MEQQQQWIPTSKLRHRNKSPTSRTAAQQQQLYKRQIKILDNNEYFPTGAMHDWSIPTNHHHHDIHDKIPQNAKKHCNPITNPKHAIIVHNNWIEGKDAKIQRFTLAHLWHPSGWLPAT